MEAPIPKQNEALLEELNRKIVELKRKIVLAEGQKRANIEEWEDQKKAFTDKIGDLKKDIKLLTAKLKFLYNPTKKNQKGIQQEYVPKKNTLPAGAKSVDDGVRILDLQIIDIKKQTDLVQARILKRQEQFDKLAVEYQKLLEYKNEKAVQHAHPPETMEEDANRKLITRLENEIHKTEVQWSEAEHIRKKYRAIKSSLMQDSEKFESTLKELEDAIKEQQSEIHKLQSLQKEAVQMRDATRSVLQKQEQQTISSNKSRDRQASEFRRQVEERKTELERLERKIFQTGTKIIHQESGASGERIDDEEAIARDNKAMMEANFKKLMNATGVAVPNELIDRFLAQREASARLTYLRNVTENEKKQLEQKREIMTQQLDVFKFSDNRESEVNQEELEKVKKDIEEHKKRKKEYEKEAEHTNSVLGSIKDALIEMLLKLQEVEENVEMQTKRKTKPEAKPDISDLVSGNISNEQLVKTLEEKVKLGMIASGQLADVDSGLSDAELDDTEFRPTIPIDQGEPGEERVKTPSVTSFAMDEKEKPPPYPTVYSNLIAGRSTGLVSSASPGAGQNIPSEEEAEVPSRSYLKRQAQLILDAKSRRKGGFRATTRRK